MLKKLKYIICFFLIIITINSCKKDKEEYVPYVYVDEYINITLPKYNPLNAIGGWMYLEGGSQGLIVYRLTNENFNVYDRHCPYNPKDNCVADIDSSGIMILDKCSGSEYSMLDGGSTKGPGVLPLKAYQTTFDGQVLHIYN